MTIYEFSPGHSISSGPTHITRTDSHGEFVCVTMHGMKILRHDTNQLSLFVWLLCTSVATAAPSDEGVDFSQDI
ncbi:MAG: hypothetical protein NZ744_01040, partial [Pirellulaceae bacterium]|nr:hypothetical protein [Pirellulaceae bacterium]